MSESGIEQYIDQQAYDPEETMLYRLVMWMAFLIWAFLAWSAK